MKRPLGMIGFFFFATLVLVTKLDFSWILPLGMGALVMGGVFLLFPRLRQEGVFPTAFFAAGAACVMAVLYLGFAVFPVQSLCGREIQAKLLLTSDAKPAGDRFLYTAEATPLEEDSSFRVTFFTDAPLDCQAYDVIQATVTLSAVEGDYRSQYFPDGIFVTASSVGEIQVTGEKSRPLSFHFYRFQKAAEETIREALSPSAASIVTGVTMGDKESMDDKLADEIRVSGSSHMFAVSGMHIAIFGQAIVTFLKALGLKKRRCAAYALGIVWCFIGICGFPYSSVRSGIMFSIYAIGLALYTTSDALNSLGISLLLMALLNPFCAMDLGLLLSASATLGIILLASKLTRRLMKRFDKNKFCVRWIQPLVGIAAVSFSATVFTLPISILSFGWVSTYSLLTNLLLFFAPYVILFCTPLALLCSALGLGFLAKPLFFADGLAANWMHTCVKWVAGLPYAYLPAGENAVLLALAGCLVLVALFLLLAPRSRRLLRLTALGCALLLALSFLSCRYFSASTPRIYLTKDSGGISALVMDGDRTALIGCGSKNNHAMQSLLRSKRLERLDAVVLPDLSKGYAGGADAILDLATPKILYAPDQGPNRSVLDGRGEILPTKPLPAETLWLWDGVSVGLSPKDGALFLTVGNTEITFLLPSQIPHSDLQAEVAVSPPALTGCNAKTLLLGGEWEGNYSEHTSVYTATDGGLLLIPKEETILIRRW